MPLKNIDKIGVSVVIVTYNGVERLKPTIEHLINQKDISFEWEVLLVDNNSTDGTADFVKKLWDTQASSCKLRIVSEPKPGQSAARERGIKESNYQYLLFCDDDNWLNENYVKAAFEIINSAENIAAVGGIGIMEYEQDFTPPTWLKPFERSYGTTAQGIEDGDTTNWKGCLYTAGTILNRKWIGKLYNLGFSSSLKGRIGTSLTGGEDIELTYALKLIGGKLFYSSKMHFKHFMPKQRITWDYLKRLWNSFGYSDYIISCYPNYFHKKTTKTFIVELLHTIRDWRYLYFKAKRENAQEGDKILLDIERLKGKLNALLFARQQFLKSQNTLETLLKNSRNAE
ncbi:MAG TPA: glycosyltransferase [Chitinophagales bacterium]|nr:glycosyltransferase [Chitinophagales bacterium]HRP38772.1 glycosyltransferase [Chitinophagales bacterium]